MNAWAPAVFLNSPILHSAELFLLAGVGFLAIGSLSSAGIVRVVGTRLSRWEPAARHRALLLLAAMPVLTALGLLLAASLPSLISLVVPSLDHCALHEDGHAHLCFVHLPRTGIGITLGLGLVFVASYVLVRGAFAASGTWRALRVLSTLAKTGQERLDLGVTVLETSQPICIAAGLFRPRVLFSRGLIETLGEQERDILLAHERAHVRRRDAFFASFARGLVLAQFPATARWLVSEIEIAAEQACDEEAAGVVGDRVAVASTILAVERATQDATAKRLAPLALAFAERAIGRRVESLLAAPAAAPTRWPRAVVTCFGAAALGALGISGELHHATESLLSIIAR